MHAGATVVSQTLQDGRDGFQVVPICGFLVAEYAVTRDIHKETQNTKHRTLMPSPSMVQCWRCGIFRALLQYFGICTCLLNVAGCRRHVLRPNLLANDVTKIDTTRTILTMAKERRCHVTCHNRGRNCNRRRTRDKKMHISQMFELASSGVLGDSLGLQCFLVAADFNRWET